jgi:hypothetical protein
LERLLLNVAGQDAVQLPCVEPEASTLEATVQLDAPGKEDLERLGAGRTGARRLGHSSIVTHPAGTFR